MKTFAQFYMQLLLGVLPFIYAAPTTIEERETACIALGTCPPVPKSDPVTVIGAPDDDVSCPVPLKDGTFQYFTKSYVSENIKDIIDYGKKKGSYPKPFNPKSDKADQFDFLNDCGDHAEDILELPMYIEDGKEVFWSRNSDSNNNKPGPFREYYILNDNKATYCGAYAHKDLNSDGDFVVCH